MEPDARHAGITDMLNGPATSAGSRYQRIAPIVNRELRRSALNVIRQFVSASARQTLQPEELVAEFYLRLLRDDTRRWVSRKHFFSYAAAVMRNILIDRHRARAAGKRQGGSIMPLSEASEPSHAPMESVEIHLILEDLRSRSARQAQIVEMHLFEGLDMPAIAAVLGVSTKTVQRDWLAARAWLYAELRRGCGVRTRRHRR